MQYLTIYRQFFTNADCYKQPHIQTPIGIQVHSTGSNNPNLKRYVQPDDGRLGYNRNKNSHNRPGVTVCANAYIGKLADGSSAIYQTLPWNYRCWLSGSGKNGNANRLGYIGYEICEDGLNNQEYFNSVVMNLSTKLDAYLCKTYNIPIDMIRDHSELARLGLASNHADISHWLKKFNITMSDYREKVSSLLKEGVQVTYVNGEPDHPVPKEGKVVIYSKSSAAVNLRQSPSINAKTITLIPNCSVGTIIENYDDSWTKIQYNDQIGYVMNDFLYDEKTELLRRLTSVSEILKGVL